MEKWFKKIVIGLSLLGLMAQAAFASEEAVDQILSENHFAIVNTQTVLTNKTKQFLPFLVEEAPNTQEIELIFIRLIGSSPGAKNLIKESLHQANEIFSKCGLRIKDNPQLETISSKLDIKAYGESTEKDSFLLAVMSLYEKLGKLPVFILPREVNGYAGLTISKNSKTLPFITRFPSIKKEIIPNEGILLFTSGLGTYGIYNKKNLIFSHELGHLFMDAGFEYDHLDGNLMSHAYNVKNTPAMGLTITHKQCEILKAIEL